MTLSPGMFSRPRNSCGPSRNRLGVLKANGYYAGIIRDTPTGPFVNLDSPGIPGPAPTPLPTTWRTREQFRKNAEHTETAAGKTPPAAVAAPIFDPKANKVLSLTASRKQSLPKLRSCWFSVVSIPLFRVERESTAIPVPEKGI